MNDKPLFTPGPLTTSGDVKRAMLRDLGSRDAAFVSAVGRVREGLLRVAGTTTAAGYEAVLVQGSGTFGLEAVVGSVLPQDGHLLVIVNGVYGERMVRIAEVLGIPVVGVRCPEREVPSPQTVERALDEHASVTHAAMVHCETTTGIVNPVAPMGKILKDRGVSFILDSMSGFGALPVDLPGWGVDFLVSSANKCLEGVPGFSIVICRREALLETEGRARSLSLDLLAQWRGLESNGQFRFTPPTHSILALEQALKELEAEGGTAGRLARYRENHALLLEGMEDLGFETYLDASQLGPIITSFRYLRHPNFTFELFYDRLNDLGYVIYPGKVSDGGKFLDTECFRIGTIGRLDTSHVRGLLGAVARVLRDMGIS